MAIGQSKVLVTGATGSCGSYLCEWIHRERPDVDVVGIGRGRPRWPISGVRYVTVDLYESPLTLWRLFEDWRPDWVFHLASEADVRASFDDPGRYWTSNAAGTFHLFEALRHAKLRPKVMLASTPEVYGAVNIGVPVREWELLPRPANPYAATKLAQEAVAHAYSASYDIPVVITRAGGYVNPRRRSLVLTAFARQIAEIEAGTRPILRHGSLESVRSWMDVRDVVAAYWLALDHLGDGRGCFVYHVAGTHVESVGDALSRLIAMTPATRFDLMPDTALARPTDVGRLVLDTTRFRAATGWSGPTIPFESSLEWLLDEQRALVRAGASS